MINLSLDIFIILSNLKGGYFMYEVKVVFEDGNRFVYLHNSEEFGQDAIFELISDYMLIYETKFSYLCIGHVEESHET